MLGPHFTALVAWQGILWKVAPALHFYPIHLLFPTYPGLLAALDHFGPLTSMGASGPPLAQVGFRPHAKLQPCQADPLFTPKEMVLTGQCLWHYLPRPSLHPLRPEIRGGRCLFGLKEGIMPVVGGSSPGFPIGPAASEQVGGHSTGSEGWEVDTGEKW